MYQLNHPHIVKLYNHFEDNDNFYLILQMCSKGQLYSKLKKDGRLNERQTAQYMREVIQAVQYLHSLDPPIIHRDIKPENILLDKDDRVKLGDFGWSNFFNDSSQRTTYCGTPEYLAPEMIKQKGHDKNLDIWNLGVLLFELLTGRPPFEGKDQQKLFESILKFQIKWPKGFSPVAKDLVQKLLKTNPSERIQLDEITNHPWFQNQEELHPNLVIEAPITSAQKLRKEGDLNPDEYKPVTQPSMQDRHKPKEHKLISNIGDTPVGKQRESNLSKELTRKIASIEEESKQKDLQIEMLKGDNENLKTQINSLEEQLEASDANSRADEDGKLLNEISILKSKLRDKENLLSDLNNKHVAMRATETQLKMAQNEIDFQINKVNADEEKFDELKRKYSFVENQLVEQRARAEKAEREREQAEAEGKQRYDSLESKYLNKLETEESQDDEAYSELLGMCKREMEEIQEKMRKTIDSEQIIEQMREENLQKQKEVNQVRLRYEKESLESNQEHIRQLEECKEGYESKRKQLQQKLADEVKVKSERIIELEKRQLNFEQEKAKNEALIKQLKEIQEREMVMKTNISVLKQEKVISQETSKKLKEQVEMYKPR